MFVLTLEGILIKWRGQELTLRNSTSQRDSWRLKHETIWRQSPESLPPSFLFIRQENLMFFWWSFYHPMVKTCLTTACWARSRANAQGKHHSQSRPFKSLSHLIIIRLIKHLKNHLHKVFQKCFFMKPLPMRTHPWDMTKWVGGTKRNTDLPVNVIKMTHCHVILLSILC